MTGSLGNVISRLQGLKNVSGRKVMPGADFLKKLEEVDTDVSGTAPSLPKFSNFNPPPQNLPEADLGGELTPQSYDVRANSVNNEKPQDAEFFAEMGRHLAEISNAWKQPEQNNQPQISEQIPQEPESEPGFFSHMKDFGKNLYQSVSGDWERYNQGIEPEVLPRQGRNVTTFGQAAGIEPIPEETIPLSQKVISEDVTKAVENPWQYAAYGSAEDVSNHPALKAEASKIIGQDYTDEIAAQVSKYEEAMKGVEDSFNGINTQLDSTAEGIKQRITNNQSTDSDKYFIGLALLMPLIVGGLFGKEAGLGALSGGAKGYADILGRKQENLREDEAALMDINKQKGSNLEKLANISAEKAKLEPALTKAIPKNPNEHLMGMNQKVYVDPVTGQNQQIIEIAPDLWAKSEFANSPERIANMQKAANQLSEVKSYTDSLNEVTNDISKIVSQLAPENDFSKMATAIFAHQAPGSIPKMTQDVMFDGRKVNAGLLLQEKLGFLATMYAQAQKLGQLDRAAQDHMAKIIQNPTTSMINPQDSIDQMMEIRNLTQKGLVNSAANSGFVPEFLVNHMESDNKEFIGGLNDKENQKRVAHRNKQALHNEAKYVE